jgi:subtilisin family serine protease
MMNRLSRWAPLAGVAYVVLFAVLLFGTPGTPDLGDSSAKIIHDYSSHRGAMQVSVYLLAYCAVFMVVFFAALTSYLRRMGADVLARVAFAGSVIVAAGFGIGAGATSMLTHKSVPLDAGTAQTLNLIDNDLPFIALFVGLLLAMIATGVAVLGTNALPAWMGWVAIVAGVASGVGSFVSWIALMLASLWILVASVMLYQRMNAESGAAMPAGGSSTVPAQGMPQASDTRIGM